MDIVFVRASGWELNLVRGYKERRMDLGIRRGDERSVWKRKDDLD